MERLDEEAQVGEIRASVLAVPDAAVVRVVDVDGLFEPGVLGVVVVEVSVLEGLEELSSGEHPLEGFGLVDERERGETDRGVVAGEDVFVEPAVGLLVFEDVSRSGYNGGMAFVDAWVEHETSDDEPGDRGQGLHIRIVIEPIGHWVLSRFEVAHCAIRDEFRFALVLGAD